MKTEEINGVFPPFYSGPKSEFKDSAEWDKMLAKTRYRMPGWEVMPTIQSMELWLDRLDINKRVYVDQTQTSLKDWVILNPGWPLRAFVGLLLEFKK